MLTLPQSHMQCGNSLYRGTYKRLPFFLYGKRCSKNWLNVHTSLHTCPLTPGQEFPHSLLVPPIVGIRLFGKLSFLTPTTSSDRIQLLPFSILAPILSISFYYPRYFIVSSGILESPLVWVLNFHGLTCEGPLWFVNIEKKILDIWMHVFWMAYHSEQHDKIKSHTISLWLGLK